MGDCKPPPYVYISSIANSKEKKDVAFNQLPDLVKEWDQTQQASINKFQQ